jgi:methyl-accepting chemotaxis protein
VFRNVEQTQSTSERIAERITTLSGHTRRITAILDVIRGIANKSDILALNASLEGARAGDAGRGFSLVASQMQRLAENVMDSVKDVSALTDDIEAATNATVMATEEGTKLAAKATTAARQISVTSKQQRSSTEQVSAAMVDIGEVAKQVSAGSTQTLSATRDLTRLADDLQKSIQSFQL